MSDAFGAGYSSEYDLLYADKDYEAEVAFIERAIARWAPQARSIVDFGCGSGNHALPLARAGFEVTGVDRSTHMLARAREKARVQPTASFAEGDVRSVHLGASFDVALMMFAVLGYQLTDSDVAATLENVRAHLSPGGLLVFDVWYGPAVLATGPERRTKVMRERDREVTRIASATLSRADRRADVHYDVRVTESAREIACFEERHAVRYFFADEIERFLGAAGFEKLSVNAFGTDAAPSEDSWNVSVIARMKAVPAPSAPLEAR